MQKAVEWLEANTIQPREYYVYCPWNNKLMSDVEFYRTKGEIMNGWRFCPECDYGITKALFERSRIPPNQNDCPGCGKTKWITFYIYGSLTHKTRRDAWEKGNIEGRPLPFPEEN